MVVYQALKALTGSVSVNAALDDSEYQSQMPAPEDDSEYDSEVEKAKGPGVKEAVIGQLPATPILCQNNDEEGPPIDPTELDRGEMVRGQWTRKQAYERREVTWLNHPPSNPDELAVAYLTVR